MCTQHIADGSDVPRVARIRRGNAVRLSSNARVNAGTVRVRRAKPARHLFLFPPGSELLVTAPTSAASETQLVFSPDELSCQWSSMSPAGKGHAKTGRHRNTFGMRGCWYCVCLAVSFTLARVAAELPVSTEYTISGTESSLLALRFKN